MAEAGWSDDLGNYVHSIDFGAWEVLFGSFLYFELRSVDDFISVSIVVVVDFLWTIFELIRVARACVSSSLGKIGGIADS